MVEGEFQALRATLHFFDESVVLVRYDEAGGRTACPVMLSDVAQALAEVSMGSGLLPANVLFWQRLGGAERIGVYVPPGRWRVTARLEPDVAVEWNVPMPPLLWVGQGRSYRVWALKRRPTPPDGAQPLWRAPLPNVYDDGPVCAGTVQFPVCGPATIGGALERFFASEFNTHLAGNRSLSHPQSVWELLARLDGRRRFPLSDLVRDRMTLGDLVDAKDCRL